MRRSPLSMRRLPLPMHRSPLPPRIVSHVPTYRTIRALVPTDARSQFNRYDPAMTIATAANAVTPTPNAVMPFPERVIIITMAVSNIAELDIHVAELPIDNAELSISVSEFAPNYPTVAGDNAKESTSPAVTPTALLYLIIYIPFIKRVGWVVHCSLHGVMKGRGDDTKSFVPFQGFALCVCVWWRIFPRTGSRISATTHRHACPVAG